MAIKVLAALGIYCFYLLFLTFFFFADKYVGAVVKLYRPFFPFIGNEKVKKFLRITNKLVSIPMAIGVIYIILLICVEEILDIVPEFGNIPGSFMMYIFPLTIALFLSGISCYHFSSEVLSKREKITEEIERKNKRLRISSVVLILTVPFWEILIFILVYK